MNFEHLECTIKLNKLDDKIRNEVLNIIENRIKNTKKISNIDRTINNKITYTKKFMKENNSIFFTRSDKGNVTVAIERSTYIQKVEKELNNENYYIPVKKKPLRHLKT